MCTAHVRHCFLLPFVLTRCELDRSIYIVCLSIELLCKFLPDLQKQYLVTSQRRVNHVRALSHRRWTLLWREWQCDVIWSRDSVKKSSCVHSRPQCSACKAAKPGQAFLLRVFLFRWVVFEDHENTFPSSVASLVDTRNQTAYPPHKLKRVVKLNDGAASLSATSRVNCRPTKYSVLSSVQHRRPQLRKARAHERRDYRACLSRSLSLSLTREEAPIGFLAWICSVLRHGKSGGARHLSECRQRVSGRIDQNQKKKRSTQEI